MDALKHLISNIPDWLKRLEELNGQIEKRQIELAALTESQCEKPLGPRSVRNKGSTESLRPKDEDEARRAREETPQPVAEQATPTSPADSQSPSAIARQTSQARAAGQARARATLRRRQRSDSVISAEGAAPKYRTRSMIIVYYDSYVQLFFEDLVKFVSASRNMMRKAKMAAKVAQIKRLAEMEMPDDDDEETDGNNDDVPKVDANAPIAPIEAANGWEIHDLPGARWVSTRRMQSPGMLMAQAALGRSMYSRAGFAGRSGFGRGLEPLEKDVYDDLDKGLEFVQSMCEHAAHQFLRDGDCGEEVDNIATKMAETKALADKEFERVQREEPEALKADEDQTRVRSYRPPSMRKDLGTSSPRAEASKETLKDAAKSGASSPNIIEVDEGIEVDKTPKAKGTRMMT